jgi:hypothetical protein
LQRSRGSFLSRVQAGCIASREENLAAANIELSPEDLREIDSAASNISLQGAHYPENLQKMVGRYARRCRSCYREWREESL